VKQTIPLQSLRNVESIITGLTSLIFRMTRLVTMTVILRPRLWYAQCTLFIETWDAGYRFPSSQGKLPLHGPCGYAGGGWSWDCR